MRGRRAKKYRKIMQQYSQTFGFREPYQVLVTPSIVLEAARMKIDLVAALDRTVRGTAPVKPMITYCCMRQVFDTKDQSVIESTIRFERKRCGHHTLTQPLSTLECLRSCVDPKGVGANTHRYIVAALEPEIRAELRSIPGVPLIYIARSVVILEPVSGVSKDARERAEREKILQGIKSLGKRKRAEPEDTLAVEQAPTRAGRHDQDGSRAQKTRNRVKGPNPLSVKKPKKKDSQKPAQDKE